MLAPAQFPVQIAKLVPKPFDGDDWLFEIKHDGFRILAIRDGASTRLFTRNGRDITRGHRHLVKKFESLREKRFVLDGELVVLDDDGRSNFSRLMNGRTGTHFYVFDLLLLGRKDFRSLPLEGRKTALGNLLGAKAKNRDLVRSAITSSAMERHSSKRSRRRGWREWSPSAGNRYTTGV